MADGLPDEFASAAEGRVSVRWTDIDALGHVSAMYVVSYLSEGRDQWLRAVLGPKFKIDSYALARIELNYRDEIPLGTPYVRTRHTDPRIGRSSVTLQEDVLLPDGRRVADGSVVIVMWEPEARRSRPLTDVEVTRFKQTQETLRRAE